ncbi:hypothetical protein EPI10_011690 [Gossypium australe]|uniref:Uncharacterized protein n=1 Tax=Gossypium australe TaxID=47621 RepID=A0A5B6W7J9_9ROSI|nr:hypothetical protein EPI10_011690 [Gossypium australe]
MQHVPAHPSFSILYTPTRTNQHTVGISTINPPSATRRLDSHAADNHAKTTFEGIIVISHLQWPFRRPNVARVT